MKRDGSDQAQISNDQRESSVDQDSFPYGLLCQELNKNVEVMKTMFYKADSIEKKVSKAEACYNKEVAEIEDKLDKIEQANSEQILKQNKLIETMKSFEAQLKPLELKLRRNVATKEIIELKLKKVEFPRISSQNCLELVEQHIILSDSILLTEPVNLYVQNYPEGRLEHKFKINQKRSTDYFIEVDLTSNKEMQANLVKLACYMFEITSPKKVFFNINEQKKDERLKIEKLLLEEDPCLFYKGIVHTIQDSLQIQLWQLSKDSFLEPIKFFLKTEKEVKQLQVQKHIPSQLIMARETKIQLQQECNEVQIGGFEYKINVRDTKSFKCEKLLKNFGESIMLYCQQKDNYTQVFFLLVKSKAVDSLKHDLVIQIDASYLTLLDVVINPNVPGKEVMGLFDSLTLSDSQQLDSQNQVVKPTKKEKNTEQNAIDFVQSELLPIHSLLDKTRKQVINGNIKAHLVLLNQQPKEKPSRKRNAKTKIECRELYI